MFLEELAADYRGWDGERSWQTNDRSGMRLTRMPSRSGWLGVGGPFCGPAGTAMRGRPGLQTLPTACGASRPLEGSPFVYASALTLTATRPHTCDAGRRPKAGPPAPSRGALPRWSRRPIPAGAL
ncbi:DUF6228 family protein [Streptomyces sp. NPDC048352]|uniref:DUF6228 family protein n=1 Tax=Streptomyces sp. NPDC048352 TaxID=3154718 RepID=UPI003430BBAB